MPDRSSLTVEAIAGALVDVLDQLGIERAVGIGSDTGGAITQIAAGAHPERFSALVLCSCDALNHFPPPLLRPLRPLAGLPAVLPAVGWVFSLGPTFTRPGPLNLLCRRPVERSLVESWLGRFRSDPSIRRDFAAVFTSMRPELTLAAAERLRDFPGRRSSPGPVTTASSPPPTPSACRR